MDAKLVGLVREDVYTALEIFLRVANPDLNDDKILYHYSGSKRFFVFKQ